jgi:KDO2-lipid IV(A) lauroyltransferase
MRLLLGILWLLHLLPLAVQARIGSLLGSLLYALARERREIGRTNLRLCFPDMGPAARARLLRSHVRLMTRAMLERGLAWWAPEARLRRLVRIEHLDRLKALIDRPLILLVPHFVGLDLCATRLAMEIDAASVYSRQKSKLIDRMLYRGRTRFGEQRIFSRQEGLRPIVRALREHRPLYYLPDMDYGPRDALFVPFFGVPAATITALPRLARLTDATVLPCIARMLPGGAGYVLEVGEPWQDFPGTSVEADVRRMNAYIEEQVLGMPEQYHWLHRRFKTRPPGEPRVYP